MNKQAALPSSVLITGASSGIGLACVAEFLERGFRVFAGVRAESSPAALEKLTGPALAVLELDVTCPSSVQRAAARIDRELGSSRLQALVNNAGIATGGPLECVPSQDLRKLFEVNVIGLMDVTRAMLPILRRGKGRIINIGSVSGKIARPFLGPYCASKFALEALTNSLRMELAPCGVPVIMMSVGHVDTPLWSKAGNDLRRLAGESADEQRQYIETLAALEAWTRRPGGMAPRLVAVKVAEAVTAARPKNRYTIGASAWRTGVLGCLPSALSDWLMTRKLPKHD